MIAVVILRGEDGQVHLTGWGMLLILLVLVLIFAMADHLMDRYKDES